MVGDDVSDELFRDRCPTCPIVIAREIDVAAGREDRFAHYLTMDREPCRGPIQFAHPTIGPVIGCNGHRGLVPMMPAAEWAQVVMDDFDTVPRETSGT